MSCTTKNEFLPEFVQRMTGILKIGKALGIGTGTVQRVLMEQPRPFDVDLAEVAYASQ
jgi:hypothetical protein